MISVFDYGAGNLRSVQNTLAAIGAQYTLADDAEGLASAEKIILPGVGHFGQMMRSLDAMRVRETIVNRAKSGVPFLGICIGLQAMFEGVQYDSEGNISNASYMDYCMPRADDLPMYEVDRKVTPCPHNPLGVKGAGEAGCIGATPAVVNAVMDALKSFGILDLEMPMTSQSVWRAINK